MPPRCLLDFHCDRCDEAPLAISMGGCERVAPAAPGRADQLQADLIAVPPPALSSMTLLPAPVPRPVVIALAPLPPAAGPPGGLALRI